MIQIEPSGLIHYFKGKSHSGHQTSKGRGSHCKVVSKNTRNKLEKVWGGKVSWNDLVLEPTEDGIESGCNKEAARRTALPHTPGHEDLSSSHSCKFYVCCTIAVNHSKKLANELWQLCFLKHRDNPGMIDAGIRGGKVSQ